VSVLRRALIRLRIQDTERWLSKRLVCRRSDIATPLFCL
jgi:hypothetical protein